MKKAIKNILLLLLSLVILHPCFSAGLDDSVLIKKQEQNIPIKSGLTTDTANIYLKIKTLEEQNHFFRSNIERQNIITALSIIFASFLLILVFVLYLSNKKAQELNRQLAKERNESEEKSEEIKQQKEEIEAINNTLEAMVLQRTQELKLTVDSLSQRNKDLEQFSYIVSHNLRAPIARLIGLTEIYDFENITNPINHTVLQHSKNSAQHLDEVVKDLTYILAIRHNTNLNKEAIDLEISTQAVLGSMNGQIKESNALITFDFMGGKSIFSERSYIENILYQFISNAFKYRRIRESLHLHISTQTQGDMIKLSVKDNGMGIDLMNTNPYKIFGLYQRVHTHVEGKGLGLYLVKTQVEALGGKVDVESTKDIGSTFSILLPNLG